MRRIGVPRHLVQMTSKLRLSGGPSTIAPRCLSRTGRITSVAATAFASESHITKRPPSPSPWSPKSTILAHPSCTAMRGPNSLAKAWASSLFPGPSEYLTRFTYTTEAPVSQSGSAGSQSETLRKPEPRQPSDPVVPLCSASVAPDRAKGPSAEALQLRPAQSPGGQRIGGTHHPIRKVTFITSHLTASASQ